MDKRDFKVYKCYSNKQKEFLMNNGCEYVLIARDINSDSQFWLFLRDKKLNEVLEKYKPYNR
ncbi:MAG: hypothetical protein ACRCX8_18910 [Sarcina sp.]